MKNRERGGQAGGLPYKNAEFSVRRARTGDLDRILEIERGSFGKDAYDRKLFAAYLRQCGDLFLVARHGGAICGYSIACLFAGSAELVSIAVTRAMRGKGAAQALMESTLRRLGRRRVARMTLTVKVTNRRARRFYARYGFTKVRIVRGYYEDGGDGLLMERLTKRISA